MGSRKRLRQAAISEISLQKRDLGFLISEAVDRTMYETAQESIAPLSDVLALTSKFGMVKTTAAIRKSIKDVTTALSASPRPIDTAMAALKLDGKQGALIEAVTANEVLKFAILNSMDSVRMLILNQFKTEASKFYSDEALEFRVIQTTARSAAGAVPRTRLPNFVPFSKVTSLGDVDIYFQDTTSGLMIVGKATDDPPRDLSLTIPVPGMSPWIVPDVSSNLVYVVGRASDGEMIPLGDNFKLTFRGLGTSGAPPKGDLARKVKDIESDAVTTAKDNFRIPPPAEGAIVGIYRALRRSKAVKNPELSKGDFAGELVGLTLEQFKDLFKQVVESTTGSSRDVVSYSAADALFFAGLSSISGILGTTRPPTPAGPGGPGGGVTATGGSAGPGGSSGPAGPSGPGRPSGAGGPSPVVQHSLMNILLRPSITSGSTQAERQAALRVIDQPALRRELNALVGGNVIFTEGVDRWCKLAGIKESK